MRWRGRRSGVMSGVDRVKKMAAGYPSLVPAAVHNPYSPDYVM